MVPGIYGSKAFYTGLFKTPFIELGMTRLVFSSSENKQSDVGWQKGSVSDSSVLL